MSVVGVKESSAQQTLSASTLDRPIWVITSQDADQHDPVIHMYTDDLQQAKEHMEQIANEALKKVLGMSEKAHLNSPLYDTIGIEDISKGITIRHRKEKEDGKQERINDRIIDMIKIERTKFMYLVPTGKSQTILKTFKIVKTEPANFRLNTIPIYSPTLAPVLSSVPIPITQTGSGAPLCPIPNNSGMNSGGGVLGSGLNSSMGYSGPTKQTRKPTLSSRRLGLPDPEDAET